MSVDETSILGKVIPAIKEYSGEVISAAVVACLTLCVKRVRQFIKNFKVAFAVAGKKPNFHSQHRAFKSVNTELVKLQVRHKASRSLVFLFHNGESFFNGKSLAKMSAYSEACDNGVTSIADTCRGVIISTVPEAVSFIYDAHPDGNSLVMDTRWHAITKKGLNGGALAASFEATGVEVAIHRILYDRRDRKNPEPIGFVALQFKNTEDVRCASICNEIPCFQFQQAVDGCGKVKSNPDGKELCDLWEESSMGGCNLIEKLLNDASLQVSWYRRFVGTLFGD
jgi:hypothetical protein